MKNKRRIKATKELEKNNWKKALLKGASTLLISTTLLSGCAEDKNYSKYLDKEGIVIDGVYYETEGYRNYDDIFTDYFFTSLMDENEEIYLKLGADDTRKYIVKNTYQNEYDTTMLQLNELPANSNLKLFILDNDTQKYINSVPIIVKTTTINCPYHHKDHIFTSYYSQEKAKTLNYKKISK